MKGFAEPGAGYPPVMWMFISRRARRWVFFLVVVPLGSWLLARIADGLAERKGESRVTQALRAPQQWRLNRTAA